MGNEWYNIPIIFGRMIMEELKINTVSEFLLEIERIYKNAPLMYEDKKLKILFRGQENVSWPLLPGLFRNEIYYNKEKDIIKEMVRKIPSEFGQGNILEKLVKMQHYGVPTRLLDLTGNPLVALYFACCQNDESDGVVFVENSILWPLDNPLIDTLEGIIYRGKYFGEEGAKVIKEDHTVAVVKTPINNQRLNNQDGYFALYNYHGKYKKFDCSPLDINSDFLLAKIIIPREVKSALVKELSLLGIKKSFLFPELQYKVESVIEDVINS